MEDRNFIQYAIITLKGMAMGAADVVPGVSGGTIAFIAGIYEELITSINNIDISLFKTLYIDGLSAFWKKLNGNFLVALFLGIAISVVSLAKFISWLLVTQPILVWSFFFGLVVASVYFVGKSIEVWHWKSIGMLILGTIIAYFVTVLPPSHNLETLPYLFFCGALAICAMILPGISGAFILVLLGSYKTILDAVHERNFRIVVTVGLGAVVGLLSFSKLLKWMFNNHKNMTLAVLTGFILGSLNKIWPWKKVLETETFGDKIITIRERNISPFAFDGDNQLILALILAILGFCLIFVLEKIASKK